MRSHNFKPSPISISTTIKKLENKAILHYLFLLHFVIAALLYRLQNYLCDMFFAFILELDYFSQLTSTFDKSGYNLKNLADVIFVRCLISMRIIM